MKKFKLIILIFILMINITFGQKLTQTVRGTIVDVDSRNTLVGVAVTIKDSNPLVGSTTDGNGRFKLKNIPIGRVTLQLSYLGYDNITIPNVVVNSGKEVVLQLAMQESAITMDEVVVKVKRRKGEAVNKLALISARSISQEETKRYAGGFNDPSRILSSFAGVTTVGNGNDIIARGNSPKYMQWRLEGIQITNPNHFADQNGTGSGGMSALNNNLLSTSDFYTGAFSPEYGNALSGVYDIKMRAGNNEKFESIIGVGILGMDATLEGPIKKGYGGSFLVNYRYSTISLVKDLGLVDMEGLPKFQDAAFKVVLPTSNFGVFSLFGLAALSTLDLKNINPNDQTTPGNRNMIDNITEDFYKETNLLNLGATHRIALTDNSSLKTTLAFSTDGISDDVYESEIKKIKNSEGEFLRDSVISTTNNFINRIIKSTYTGALTYNNKLDRKNNIQIGTKYSLYHWDFDQSNLSDDLTTRFKVVDFVEDVGLVRNFISWKHRLNSDITIVAGVHNMNVLYNDKHTFEPRAAINWKINRSNSIRFGYGNHSNMESIHNYFTKIKLDDGSVIEPNKDLDLLKAHHYVLGYKKAFSKNIKANLEFYYQDLYNIPVENSNSSYYSTINEGEDFNYVDLVNEGTGENIGVELTVERFFADNYYYLVNGSLYSSKYKSLDGIERNTKYNGNYMVNLIFGKEFINLGAKKNQTLTLNVKMFLGGGQKYIPLLRDNNGNVDVDQANNKYWDYSKAYEDKIDDIFQLNISASYKFNTPTATHEIFLDLINLTGNQARSEEFYDASKPNSIGYKKIFGFFPNLAYRIYF